MRETRLRDNWPAEIRFETMAWFPHDEPAKKYTLKASGLYLGGLLWLNYEPLWETVVSNFGLIGFPGGEVLRIALGIIRLYAFLNIRPLQGGASWGIRILFGGAYPKL